MVRWGRPAHVCVRRSVHNCVWSSLPRLQAVCMYHDCLHVVLESDVCVSVCDRACAHLTASVVWGPTLPLATQGAPRKALYSPG